MMRVFGQQSGCPCSDRLAAFWDGEVPAEEQQRLEAHLIQCEACCERWRTLQALATTLQAYRLPEAGLSSDEQFWRQLAPRLRPRPLPARARTGAQPSPFLAPLGLMASSVALRGLILVVSAAYLLYQWRLLPTSLAAAFASVTQLLVGPIVWEGGTYVCTNLFAALGSVLPAPERAGYLAFATIASGLLLILAALYLAWLWRWLQSGDRINGCRGTSYG